MAMTAGFPEGEELPERIGPYLIRRRIGQGGMGVVYQGLDPRNDQFVAIKLLRPEVAGDHIARARLAREVETMRRVHSRNVAEVIDADTDARQPWVVTEYIPGPTLDSTVTDHGPLRGRALTRFVSGMAQAISDIHAADVIHRDLKPGNVIISNGEPIVIDFGIAHAVDGAKLTQTGTFVGTPSYLSPEVIEGTDLGPATDVHAWGATVAFAATGHPPYGAGSFEVIFFRILNGEINMEGMPEALQPIVGSAVSRDMASRPTAAQLVAETSRLNLDLPWTESQGHAGSGLTGKHTVQRPVMEQEGGSPSGTMAAGAAAGAGAGALAGAAAAHGAEPAPADETAEEAPRTEVAPAAEPDRTMVAGSGGETDQTMRAEPEDLRPAGPVYTAEPDSEPDVQGPRTHYFNSTLRPEDFQDILTPVEREGRSTRRADPYGESEQTSGQRTGLLGKLRRTSGDRLSDYWGGDDDDDHYDEAEPRRLPSLILVPLLVMLSSVALLLPMWGLVLGLVVAVVLTALDTVKIEHARRLQTRGPRSSDHIVIALSMPWAMVRALGTSLMWGGLYLIGGIVVGIMIGLITGLNQANDVGSFALFFVVLLTFLLPTTGAGARRQAVYLVERVGIRNVYVYWGLIVASVLLALLLFSTGWTVPAKWTMIPGPSNWFG